MKLNHFPRALFEASQHGFFDDFHWYVTAHLWANLAADGGVTAPAATDNAGGILSMATGATDNNEVAIKSSSEVFLLADDKPFVIEASLKYTEANTDDANVAFGLADAIGANLLLDDGAGPKTTFSGALIYKVDGSTVWKAASSKSTTQTLSTSITTAGGAYQKLRIEGRAVDGTNYEIIYFVDEQPLRDSNNKMIKHTVAYASATEMQVGAYIKAGGATSETLLVDYIGAWQKR